MKKLIPSSMTLMNLSLGFVAILLCDPFYSPLCILAGTIFDIFDGIVARALKASSNFGKELDSLADLVTFGVAPAYLYYHFILPKELLSIIIVALLPIFSAIRLAIFNNDSTQAKTFRGLPTPANAVFFISFPLLLFNTDIPFIKILSQNSIIIFSLPIIFSYLLVSPLRMFSFKSMGAGFSKNPIPFIFIVIVIVSLIFFKWLAVPISIFIYILLSIIDHLFFNK